MRTLALLLLLAGCRSVPPAPDWRAAVADWDYTQPLPDLPFVGHDGAPLQLSELSGDWVVVSFIFTRCGRAEACPMTLQRLARVQALSRERDVPVRVFATTLDPVFDTPERLAAFAARHGLEGSTATLATGDPELLAEVWPWMFSVLALPDAHEGIRHTVKIVLLAPGLRVVAQWKDGEVTPEAILEAVERGAP